MGQVTYSYTTTGTEGPGTNYYLGALPPLTGVCNTTLRWDTNLVGSYWVTVGQRRPSDLAAAWVTDFFPGSAPGAITNPASTSSPSGGPYSGAYISNHPPAGVWQAGITWSVTFDNPAITTAAPCAYGATPKSTSLAAVEAGIGLLDVMGIAASGGAWAYAGILAEVASPILIQKLCDSPAPSDPTINPADWTTPDPTTGISVGITKTVEKFYGQAYSFF